MGTKNQYHIYNKNASDYLSHRWKEKTPPTCPSRWPIEHHSNYVMARDVKHKPQNKIIYVSSRGIPNLFLQCNMEILNNRGYTRYINQERDQNRVILQATVEAVSLVVGSIPSTRTSSNIHVYRTRYIRVI